MEKTKRGKGTKLMAISDSAGLPVSIHIASASPPHEVITLAEPTVTKCFVADEKPERLIGDKAYGDSDPLDVKLAVNHEVELIVPHRYNRQAFRTQDGRVLRRYKRRWKGREIVFMAAEFSPNPGKV